ncbi:molybdate ABC transporter substrate-binding protein [Aliivibrio sp. S3MY1]|uniref:molybdate ABC transporter substrate-binding protein n=1 Tax=unclassified Aliivibrio TaxID=2645654 RepID=UPI002378800B|nr:MULTISPECIES: molybdate ABC transporter substrate-binding protein [unclassified Aliivibrio]MDD9194350.1 molybdate ABC transporter substrate-binding protein [Aliivibrio sp. S3MY1]MDD9198018.1 molybdate ABC transporter substrate-binding protein [Aliivibrio sp. S2MY1]
MSRLTLCLALLFSSLSVSANVTVYAASSLTNVMNDIVDEYQNETGEKVRVSFAGSSSLARQISNGAPADIYLSANSKWMDYLIEQDQIDTESKVDLLRNVLVLIASKSTPTENTWQWFIGQKGFRIAMADPRHVPAGLYGKQSLEKQFRWPEVKDHIASGNNVRSALLFVERDEAPLGIVYKTDALLSKEVTIVEEFPADSHDPIVYPMAIIKNKNSEKVAYFYRYLLSKKAKNIFTSYGFTTI